MPSMLESLSLPSSQSTRIDFGVVVDIFMAEGTEGAGFDIVKTAQFLDVSPLIPTPWTSTLNVLKYALSFSISSFE